MLAVLSILAVLIKYSTLINLAARITQVTLFFIPWPSGSKCSICFRIDNLTFISELCICLWTQHNSIAIGNIIESCPVPVISCLRRHLLYCNKERGTLVILIPAQPIVAESGIFLELARVHTFGLPTLN